MCVCASVCLSVYLSVSLSVCLSVSICMCAYLCLCLCLCVLVYYVYDMSVILSVCVCVCVCMRHVVYVYMNECLGVCYHGMACFMCAPVNVYIHCLYVCLFVYASKQLQCVCVCMSVNSTCCAHVVDSPVELQCENNQKQKQSATLFCRQLYYSLFH